ncbi:hypothetical protein Trydic_g17812 [Trypoxylus dichotomus]
MKRMPTVFETPLKQLFGALETPASVASAGVKGTTCSCGTVWSRISAYLPPSDVSPLTALFARLAGDACRVSRIR